MTANEHDAHRRARLYTDHIIELCTMFGVKIAPLEANNLHMERSAAGVLRDAPVFDDRTRVVFIAEPTDEPTYAAALHELGHVLAPLGMVAAREGSRHYRLTRRPYDLRDVRLELEAERAAWEWAHAHAIEWTEVMTFVEATAMATYLKAARRYGIKED
jgi:hypothetical protein